LANTHEIPYPFIIAGPYIAIGVQDLEPLSEEKRQDAASTLICVNRRCPGRKSIKFIQEKSPKAATLGLLWVI
jgi:hypothetical protein